MHFSTLFVSSSDELMTDSSMDRSSVDWVRHTDSVIPSADYAATESVDTESRHYCPDTASGCMPQLRPWWVTDRLATV